MKEYYTFILLVSVTALVVYGWWKNKSRDWGENP